MENQQENKITETQSNNQGIENTEEVGMLEKQKKQEIIFNYRWFYYSSVTGRWSFCLLLLFPKTNHEAIKQYS